MIKYLALFVSTLLDHVGVPVPLIVTVVLLRNQKIQIIVSFFVVLCALIFSDLVTFYFGKYFNKIASKNKDSVFAKAGSPNAFQKVLNIISRTVLMPGLWIILFNKFIPIVGKYIPLMMGYNKHSFKKCLILFLFANTFYALFYVTTAYYFGEAIKNGQTLLSIFFLSLFACIYLLTYIVSKKKNEQQNYMK